MGAWNIKDVSSADFREDLRAQKGKEKLSLVLGVCLYHNKCLFEGQWENKPKHFTASVTNSSLSCLNPEQRGSSFVCTDKGFGVEAVWEGGGVGGPVVWPASPQWPLRGFTATPTIYISFGQRGHMTAASECSEGFPAFTWHWQALPWSNTTEREYSLFPWHHPARNGGRRGGTAGGHRGTICCCLIVSAASLRKSTTSVSRRSSWVVTITGACDNATLETEENSPF